MRTLKSILSISFLSLICISALAEERVSNDVVVNSYHIACYTPSGFKIFDSDVQGYTVSNASFITVTMLNGKTLRLANAICKIEDK